jgi:peptide/nickel transport system permease protein
MLVLGAAILGMLLLLALSATWIVRYNPSATNTALGLSAPSLAHLMGTDQLGRDILSRVIYGARLSILVSVAAVTISVSVGTVLGVGCGYLRGPVDAGVMRAMEVLLAFPGLVLALVFAAVLGPGVRSVIIAVGIAGVPTFARVTRGTAMSIAAEDYVLAARSLGYRTVRVIVRHSCRVSPARSWSWARSIWRLRC